MIKTCLGLLPFLVGGEIVTIFAYQKTQKTMWDEGKNEFLPISSDLENWELVWNDLHNPEHLGNSEISSISKPSYLRDWCKYKYKTNFWHIFKSPDWIGLEEIRTGCLLPIKSKLKNSEKLSNVNEITENTNKLKGDHTNKKYKLTSELEKISKDNDNNINQKLFDWCMNSYKKGYQGDETNLYTLVKEFCIKKNT